MSHGDTWPGSMAPALAGPAPALFGSSHFEARGDRDRMREAIHPGAAFPGEALDLLELFERGLGTYGECDVYSFDNRRRGQAERARQIEAVLLFRLGRRNNAPDRCWDNRMTIDFLRRENIREGSPVDQLPQPLPEPEPDPPKYEPPNLEWKAVMDEAEEG